MFGREIYLPTVYVIYNDINDAKYVGCTTKSIEDRFNTHVIDSKRVKCKHRPLYVDMNKFGLEHFFIDKLEDVDESDMFVREEFWIKKLDSYYNGYNMSLGGKSRKTLDYGEIITLYKDTTYSQKEIALSCGCSADSVRKVISSQFDVTDWKDRNTVGVRCVDLDIYFKSIADASRFVIENKISSSSKIENVRIAISRVLRKERKSAFGFRWERV